MITVIPYDPTNHTRGVLGAIFKGHEERAWKSKTYSCYVKRACRCIVARLVSAHETAHSILISFPTPL